MTTTSPDFIARHVSGENVETSMYKLTDGRTAVRVKDLDVDAVVGIQLYVTQEVAAAMFYASCIAEKGPASFLI